MIYGIGHDILELERVSRILDGKSRGRFLQRVLTPAELKVADLKEPRLSEWVAGRFAVKEALAKAIGCGIGQQVGFQDIEVLPDTSGKPLAKLSAEAWTRIRLNPDRARIHVTISHQPGMASAFCVIEQL
ncbi:holo-ACP synthase [Paenibacillus marinisediminis]